MADIKKDELVFDLYTGTGTIALFMAEQAREVVGIELIPEAIEDAKLNAKNNGVENATFYAGDMRAVFTADFIAKHGNQMCWLRTLRAMVCTVMSLRYF